MSTDNDRPTPLELEEASVVDVIPPRATDVEPVASPLQRDVVVAGYEENSVTVTATGKSTKISSFYAEKIAYKFDCVYCTTFGPEILGYVTFAAARIILKIIWPVQMRLQVIAMIGNLTVLVLFCAYKNDKVDTALFFTFGALSCITALIDVILFFSIDIPLRVAWSSAFMIHQPGGKDRNEFLTYTAENCRALFISDRQELFIAIAERRQIEKLKVMIYNDYWRSEFNYSLNPFVNVCGFLFYPFCLAFNSLNPEGWSHVVYYVCCYILSLLSIMILYFVSGLVMNFGRTLVAIIDFFTCGALAREKKRINERILDCAKDPSAPKASRVRP